MSSSEKMEEHKVNYFQGLVQTGKAQGFNLVHTAKCQFCTDGITLASSSKELHQIVNTLSNRHPPKILPTIYLSADLPSIFIRHFTNNVKKNSYITVNIFLSFALHGMFHLSKKL